MTTCISISCLPSSPHSVDAINFCKNTKNIRCIYFLGDGVAHGNQRKNPFFNEWQKLLSKKNINAFCCVNSIQAVIGEKGLDPGNANGNQSRFTHAGIGLFIEALIECEQVVSFRNNGSKLEETFIQKNHTSACEDEDRQTFCVQTEDIYNLANMKALFNTALMLKIFEQKVCIQLNAPEHNMCTDTIDAWLPIHQAALEQLGSLEDCTLYTNHRFLSELRSHITGLKIKYCESKKMYSPTSHSLKIISI